MAKSEKSLDTRSPGDKFRGNDNISNQIRRLRFENGEMTQQELADKAGVTRQTIIATEKGRYCPSLSLAFRIARAFGVGIKEVFEYNSSE